MGGGPLPERVDNADPLYRRWKRWNTSVIMSAWEDFNRYVKSIGGPDCLYMGMVRKGSALNREIAIRSPALMMDMQSRNDSGSFHELVDEGRYMHSMLGWDKPMAIASALYHHSHGYYRLTADPAVEARMYMKGALTGGVYPWWHSVASYTPDRRLVETPPPVFAWIAKNESTSAARRSPPPVSSDPTMTRPFFRGPPRLAAWRRWRWLWRRRGRQHRPGHPQRLVREQGALLSCQYEGLRSPRDIPPRHGAGRHQLHVGRRLRRGAPMSVTAARSWSPA